MWGRVQARGRGSQSYPLANYPFSFSPKGRRKACQKDLIQWAFEGYPRHQNDYMQLFLLSGINFLKIIITITFFNP